MLGPRKGCASEPQKINIANVSSVLCQEDCKEHYLKWTLSIQATMLIVLRKRKLCQFQVPCFPSQEGGLFLSPSDDRQWFF